MQQEAVSAIDEVVITNLAETEGGRKFAIVAGLPSDTGLEGYCIVSFLVKQSEITAKVGKQEELMADGAARVTDVGL